MNAQSPSFPANLVARDLNGRTVDFSRELSRRPATLLLIAFQRDQQPDLDGWIAGLGLESGRFAWIECPVIDDPGLLGRWFIDTGMRRGIPDRADRAHVVTIYTAKPPFFAALGLPGEKEVHAVVLDAVGRRLALASGPFLPAKAAPLLETLDRPR